MITPSETSLKDTLNVRMRELSTKIVAHRTTDVMQRITLYCINKTGKKLNDFLQNGSSDNDKLAVVNELHDIIDKGEWDRLPKVPQGQAATKTPTAIAPKPVAPVPAPVPAPRPAFIPAPVPAPVPVDEAPEADVPASVVVELPTPVGDPASQLAALIAQLVKPAAPAAPSITAEEVRKIVRAELALVFTKVASALIK